jgi:hypothetical protein
MDYIPILPSQLGLMSGPEQFDASEGFDPTDPAFQRVEALAASRTDDRLILAGARTTTRPEEGMSGTGRGGGVQPQLQFLLDRWPVLGLWPEAKRVAPLEACVDLAADTPISIAKMVVDL